MKPPKCPWCRESMLPTSEASIILRLAGNPVADQPHYPWACVNCKMLAACV